jgi:hypothetical protein
MKQTIIIIIFNIIIHFIILLSSIYATKEYNQCFETALIQSQSCSNNNIIYFSHEGIASGFGSEFNHYLIHTLIDGILSNQRIVLLVNNDKKGPWDYDCPELLSWACYLKFPCIDSVINYNNRNISIPIHHGNMPSRDINNIKQRLQLSHKQFKWTIPNDICDVNDFTATYITSISAQYLFQLNDKTTKFVNNFNNDFKLQKHKYISVQIRATDKSAEMDKVFWHFMNNMTLVATYIKQKLHHNVSMPIYVSLDNCSVFGAFKKEFPKDTIIFSPCEYNGMLYIFFSILSYIILTCFFYNTKRKSYSRKRCITNYEINRRN